MHILYIYMIGKRKKFFRFFGKLLPFPANLLPLNGNTDAALRKFV
tara:strand:- start:1052 stop:1186 length:135 start_codon:yes stop_codon:yes gene_type:complete